MRFLSGVCVMSLQCLHAVNEVLEVIHNENDQFGFHNSDARLRKVEKQTNARGLTAKRALVQNWVTRAGGRNGGSLAAVGD